MMYFIKSRARVIQDKQGGFTFIELMVAMIVVFILFLIINVNYSNIKKELALVRGAHKVAQDLRRTQEAAMSAKYSPSEIIFNIDKKNSYYVMGKEVFLERNIEIINLSPDSPLTVSFTPPNPDVSINGVSSDAEAEIVISNKTAQKKIKINTAGRIDIQ